MAVGSTLSNSLLSMLYRLTKFSSCISIGLNVSLRQIAGPITIGVNFDQLLMAPMVTIAFTKATVFPQTGRTDVGAEMLYLTGVCLQWQQRHVLYQLIGHATPRTCCLSMATGPRNE